MGSFRGCSNKKRHLTSFFLMRVVVLSACVAGALSYARSRGPPDRSSLRVQWNVTGDALRLQGCQVNASEEHCDFHFFKAKFVFLDDKILIGARNQLHIVDKALRTIRNVVWNPDREKKQLCIDVSSDVKRETDCENYIKFVQRYPHDPSRLLVCGTFSLYRACLTLNASLALTPGESIELDSGVDNLESQFGFFAKRASDTSVVTFVGDRSSNDSLILAVSPPLGTSGHYHISFINSTLGPGDSVSFTTVQSVDTTQQHFIDSPVEFREQFDANFFNSTGLNDGHTDNGELDFDFLLYNENAKEDSAGEDTRYARLARICKNDAGVSHFGKTLFQTFVKARLICRSDNSGGEFRHIGQFFYYNRITTGQLHKGTSVGSGMKWNTEQVFYGGFAGHGLGPKGSAICVFNATRSPPGQDNQGIFDIYGADYYSENGRPIANSQPFKCTKNPRSTDHALSHTLIHRPAVPIDEVPVVVIDDYVINTLVIDTVPVIVEHNNMYGHRLGLQDVMFVGMDSGEIFKLFANRTIAKHWGGVPPPPVYSEIIELADEDPKPVTDLAIQEVDEEKYLFVMSYSSAYRLPLQRCARFHNCSSCVLAKDPYCFWDTHDLKCSTLPKNVSGFTTRFVQILADEQDDSVVCNLPTASPSVTSTTAQTRTSSIFFDVHSPTPSPSATSTPPPSLTPTTVVADSLQVGSGESNGSLPLFVVGTLFLIIGASLAVIAIVILVQQKQLRAQLAKRDVEAATGHKRSKSKSKLSLDLGTPTSPSSSVNSSDVVEALGMNEVVPSETDNNAVQSSSPSQVNGHICRSIHSFDTASAVLGGARCITPSSERKCQVSPFTVDGELTHSSDA